MRDAIIEMLARRDKIGLSWSDLAQRTQHDTRTAMRQLDASSNPTLETLEQYAAALGGGIHFVPDEWKQAHDCCSELRTIVERQAETIGKLTAENEHLRERTAEQNKMLEYRLKRIETLQELLTGVVKKLLERV